MPGNALNPEDIKLGRDDYKLTRRPVTYEERVQYARENAITIKDDLDKELKEHKNRISRQWSRPSINDPRYKK